MSWIFKGKKTIAVCDDEKVIADQLAGMIKAYITEQGLDEQITVDIYYSAFALETAVDDGNLYDLIFMDIILQKENGIRLSQTIIQKLNHVKIVFITGHVEYVEDIFQIVPFALLMKPLKRDKVQQIVEKAFEMIEHEKERYIALKTADGVFKLNVARMMSVESEKKYVIFTDAEGKKYQVIMTMDEVAELVGEKLVRCHRSYFINMDMVQRIQGKNAVLTDGREVPISRNCYKNVYSRFMDVLGNI